MAYSMEDLQKLQCPMNWDIAALKIHVKVDHLVEKLTERLEANRQVWETLCVTLVLSFENCHVGHCDFSLLQHAEELIKYDLWLEKYSSSIQHVIYATQAHVYAKMNNNKSALNALSKIKLFEQMTDSEKAFVLALKASCLMLYGPSGNIKASDILTEVLKLDERESEWYFIKGKCLARQRRICYRSKPSAEELSHLRKAVNLNSECPWYLVHLARSLGDLVQHLTYNQICMEDSKVVHALNIDVVSLLRKAVTLPINSPHLLCYIARTIIKLPKYGRRPNVGLIEACVNTAFEMAPYDPTVNHTMGLLHLNKDELEEAVYFLTEASNMGVSGASIDLCRIKWKDCRAYDPVPDLTELIKNGDELACSEANYLMATYYFFVKNDLLATVEYWKHWLHCHDKEAYLVSSIFLGQEQFDFNIVLFDEIRLQMNSNRYAQAEDKSKLEEALQIISDTRPELQRQKPSRRRQDLIDKAQMLARLGRNYPKSLSHFFNNRIRKRGGVIDTDEAYSEYLEFFETRRGDIEVAAVEKRHRSKVKKSVVKEQKKSVVKEQKKSVVKEQKNQQPPKRISMRIPYLGKGIFRRSESVDDISYKKRKEKVNINEGSGFGRLPSRHKSEGSLNNKRSIGSGRVNPDAVRGILKVKALSLETLLLRTYEPKTKLSFVKFSGNRSVSESNMNTGRWSCSRESLTSNLSEADKRSGRNSPHFRCLPRAQSAEHVSGTSPNRLSSFNKDDKSWLSQKQSFESVSISRGSFRNSYNQSDNLSKSARYQIPEHRVNDSRLFQNQSYCRGDARCSSVNRSSDFNSGSGRYGSSPKSQMSERYNDRGDSASGSQSSKVWRRDRESGDSIGAPKSSFFQSWSSRSERDSSRSVNYSADSKPGSVDRRDESSSTRNRTGYQSRGYQPRGRSISSQSYTQSDTNTTTRGGEWQEDSSCRTGSIPGDRQGGNFFSSRNQGGYQPRGRSISKSQSYTQSDTNTRTRDGEWQGDSSYRTDSIPQVRQGGNFFSSRNQGGYQRRGYQLNSESVRGRARGQNDVNIKRSNADASRDAFFEDFDRLNLR